MRQTMINRLVVILTTMILAACVLFALAVNDTRMGGG